MAQKHELNWDDDAPARRALTPWIPRAGGYGFVLLILAIAAYYLIGMALTHRISDDVDQALSETPAGASRAVQMAADLIHRETEQNSWTANNPFFLPGSMLDNMPNFQQGVIYAISRFAIEMSDQLGRTRGSSEVDGDLEKAAGLLKYPGTIWHFDFSTTWAPTPPADRQYAAARRSMIAYNERLAAGDAVFERRADNLQATLERMTADLGSSSAVIDRHLEQAGGWGIDTKVDDIFYNVKGRLYGYYMLLRELGVDFERVIRDRELGAAWNQMLDSMRSAAALDPLIIMNGAPDGIAFPSHLSVQGFYLLRARTQLREIVNILQK
ncbi:DUF2333 family protein [Nisaea acidiphila]|uniref:DUF2333 family protein n=1 Tax=Nisaea acidiphila TaxID=1862145 RepID=A0A9J7AMD7_9PROT|nr:DUF2333 family protein [Nisaea acidiphila]UUX48122.1 DUF2333 family protein [Nisaea acidiphila]